MDEKGRKLVTLDEGKTWKYATRGDSSHQDRYQRSIVVVDSTANHPSPEPHHYGVQPDDPHYDTGMPNNTRLRLNPDAESSTVTGHTEAYRG